MEKKVKKSIKDMYDSIVDNYNITDDNLSKRFEDLFQKIYKLGEGSKNEADFQNIFQKSELFKEYSDIYVEITQKCEMKDILQDVEVDNDIIERTMKEDIKTKVSWMIPGFGHIRRTKNRINVLKNLKYYMSKEKDDEDDEDQD